MASTEIDNVRSDFNRLDVADSRGEYPTEMEVDTETPDERHLMLGFDYGSVTSSGGWGTAKYVKSLVDLALSPHSVMQNGSPLIPSAVAAIKKIISGTEQVELIFGAAAIAASTSQIPGFLVLYEVMKLDYFGKEENLLLHADKIAVKMYKDVKERHKNAIKVIMENTPVSGYRDSSGNETTDEGATPITSNIVYVWDPIIKGLQTRKITGHASIETEFLRFLLQSAVVDIAKEQGKTTLEAKEIVERKAEIGLSVPAVCSDQMRRVVRERLHAAGYPERTRLFCEAESAGLYHLCRMIGTGQQVLPDVKEVIILGDIGGGTVDIVALFIYTDDGAIQIGQLGHASGSLDGIEKLNRCFTSYLNKELKEDGGIKSLASFLRDGDSISDVERALEAGFELKKRNFDGRGFSRYHVVPELGSRCLDPIDSHTFDVQGNEVILPNATMRNIFDEWLEGIFMSLEQLRAKIEPLRGSKVSLSVGLSGWGSLPPYVQTKLENLFSDSKVPVIRFDVKIESVVAQGNYMSLQLRSSSLRARLGWGVLDEEGHERYVFNENDDLSGRTADSYFINGTREFSENHAPWTDALQRSIDARFGVIHSKYGAGYVQTLQIEIPRATHVVSNQEKNSGRLSFEYSVHLEFRAGHGRLVFKIPHTGQFGSEGRELAKDLRKVFPLGNIYKLEDEEWNARAKKAFESARGKGS